MVETPTAEPTKARAVSFTVAECSEFHNMGEFHENIATVKEAMEIFEKIPPKRMSAIPAVGIRVADKENPEQVAEMDVIVGKHIDLQLLEYIPEIAENKAAQFAIAEMIHAMADATIYGEVPEEIQKKVLVIESKEKQTAQLKEITDKLEQGVQDVFQSDSYKELLNVMARMPHYSINNQILIAMQTSGQATMCQSFTGWKQVGRYVKAGEKGIKIFAPAPYTIQKEMDKLDAQGKPVLDSDGEPVKETQEVTVNAFKVVNTFDISQTDGKEIPTIGVDELSGDVDRFSALMDALTEVCPVPIAFEDIPGDAKGYYSQTEKRIAIQEGMSEVQTVKIRSSWRLAKNICRKQEECIREILSHIRFASPSSREKSCRRKPIKLDMKQQCDLRKGNMLLSLPRIRTKSIFTIISFTIPSIWTVTRSFGILGFVH